ncbi:MAG: hypothetical protein ACOYOE_11185 [Chlorobium sp.]
MDVNSAIKHIFGSRRSAASNPLVDIGNTDPVCPYCEAILDKMPGRKKKCPSCGEFICVRTRPSDKKKILIKEDQILVVEEQWAIANGVHEQFLAELKAYNDERETLINKLGKEPSENDVRWSLLNKELLKHAQKYHWGLYRNARLSMGDILKAESKEIEALDTYFEVCYIDINGPNNCVTPEPEILKEYPPFNPKNAFLAPGVIGNIDKIVSSHGIAQVQAEERFIKVAERTQKSLKLPVKPGRAWKKMKKEIYGT